MSAYTGRYCDIECHWSAIHSKHSSRNIMKNKHINSPACGLLHCLRFLFQIIDPWVQKISKQPNPPSRAQGFYEIGLKQPHKLRKRSKSKKLPNISNKQAAIEGALQVSQFSKGPSTPSHFKIRRHNKRISF